MFPNHRRIGWTPKSGHPVDRCVGARRAGIHWIGKFMKHPTNPRPLDGSCGVRPEAHTVPQNKHKGNSGALWHAFPKYSGALWHAFPKYSGALWHAFPKYSGALWHASSKYSGALWHAFPKHSGALWHAFATCKDESASGKDEFAAPLTNIWF